MQKFLDWIDEIAGILPAGGFAKWLERIAFIFLILMIISAPHSIAATQIAWLTGMAAWAIRLFIGRRPRFVSTPLNYALFAFAGWSVVSAFCSYAPDISIDKLRGVGLFLIFFFIINNLRTKRAAVFLAFLLIGSSMVSVLWTPLERIIGRGVEITGISPAGPLSTAKMIEDSLATGTDVLGYTKDGDTILAVNNRKVRSPEAVLEEIEKAEVSRVRIGRLDYEYTIEVERAKLLQGEAAADRLGFTGWSHNRSWRATGFYRQFITFAEVLQIIAALTFGIFIVSLQQAANPKFKILFAVCLLSMSLALLLTVTRASQAGFLVSAFIIVLAGASRKTFWRLAMISIPLILVGLIFLQQYRSISFFDANDNSTTWRETVYREGFNLWTKSPRNFTVGVGMDSIKRFAKEWHLFDDGRLPIGHFHSTPLQLAVERGLPMLLIWIWILWIYARSLWRGFKSEIPNPRSHIERGIILGALGGLAGFLTSGMVHNNLGDGEVAMMFYILMGISIFLVNHQSPTNFSLLPAGTSRKTD